MSHTHSFYSPLAPNELQFLVQSHQEKFGEFLNDHFTEDELILYDNQIEAICAIYTGPILSELSFDDFYFSDQNEELLRNFFNSCRSSITLEQLPFLETNPFQVTYIQMLLKNDLEFLVDRGGVTELCFKKTYLQLISPFKSAESFFKSSPVKIKEVKTTRPVDPIDFLIRDVYHELHRLKDLSIDPEGLNSKALKIFLVMKEESLIADSLLRKTGLNPKDLDDGLERVKFWLRKIEG